MRIHLEGRDGQLRFWQSKVGVTLHTGRLFHWLSRKGRYRPWSGRGSCRLFFSNFENLFYVAGSHTSIGRMSKKSICIDLQREHPSPHCKNWTWWPSLSCNYWVCPFLHHSKIRQRSPAQFDRSNSPCFKWNTCCKGCLSPVEIWKCFRTRAYSSDTYGSIQWKLFPCQLRSRY